MQLGDRTAQRHQAIAKTGGIVSSDYWDFKPGQHVMTREGFAGVVVAVSDGPVAGNEEYEVKLDGGLGGGAYAPGELQPLDPPVAAEAAVNAKDYEGQVGNRDHVTRHEDGTLPTSSISRLQGVKGEGPGEHRNKKGAAWDEFKADIAANGIQNPIFITVDHGDEPRISEGNHRRDAAVELGLDEVPVEIRYFGHAEQQGTVGQRTGAVEKVRIYACPDHAPIGVAKEPDDDAQRTCSACGRTGYNVQPFMLPADVVERGWRGADFGTHRQSAVQADVRTAADDYPELGNILEERPDHEHVIPVTASLTKEGRKLIPVTDESEISRPGFEVEAGWGERLFGPAINRMYEHMPPQFQTVEQGYPSSYDWCRFRRSSHCWYSYQIDQEKSQELGRVVWVPQDRGLCPRPGWDEQKACPIGEPGPHSHDPNAKVDATLPYDAGGQRVSKVALQPKLQQPATTPVQQPGRISPNYMTPTKTRPDNPNATEFGRLSPQFQEETRARVEAQTPDARFGPLTHDRIVKNLMTLYQNAKRSNPTAISSGMTWYNHANEESRGVATAAGVSERHGYGMMAALSPRCDWDENMAQAHYMAGVLTKNQPVQMSRVALRQANAKLKRYAKDYDTGTPIPKIQNGDDWSKLHPLAVACALYGQGKNDDHLIVPTKLKKDGQPYRATWNNGVKNIVKAVRIQRGEDPDQVLSGHKVRSFFNNIMDPDNGGGFNDITIDTHAVSAASHAMMAASSKKMKQIFATGGNTHENTQGAYAYFADAYRKANQNLQAAGEPKMSPNQFQAIIWLHWRHITRHLDRNQNINIFPKYKQPAVEATAAQDQTQPSQDASGRLDPWYVPDGEHHDPDHDPDGEEDLPDDWPYNEQDEDNLKLASEAALVSEAFLAEGRWHLTAAWRDVREKAKRIKTEGGVRIIAAPTQTDTSVVAEVRGDHNIYETTITREPGKHAVAMWTCGCAWASYSWGRSGRWKRYEGRMCSHALALVYEVQAKGMFGKTVMEDREQPAWRMDPTIPVITPQNYPKPKRRHGAKDTDHCKVCGSDDLFSGWFDADDFAYPASIDNIENTPPGVRWTTFCNNCGEEQAKPRKRRASLQVEAHAPGDQVDIRVPDDHPLMGTSWWPLSPHYDGRYGRHHTKVTGTIQKVFKNGKASVAIHQMPNAQDSGDQMTTQHIETEHLHPMHEASLRPVRTDTELQVAPAVLTAQALMEQGYSPNDTLDTLIDMGLPNAVGMVAEALAIKPFKAKVRGWVRTVVKLVPGGKALLDTGHEVDASELTYPTYDPTLGLDPSLHDSVPHISVVEIDVEEPITTYHKVGQGADTKGVMICLKPPERIRKTLADLGTEPADNIHITLAYFGGVDEVDGDALHAAVRTFAEKSPSLMAEVSGLGTFENDDENVLLATWDIPGIDRFRSDLVEHCRGFDQVPYNNHGFTPHATLSYGDEPFRKLPALPGEAKERFGINEVWLTIGDEWAAYSLQPMGAKASRITFHVEGVSENVEAAADMAQSMVRSNGGKDVTIEQESLSGDVTIATANDMSAWWSVDGAERMTNIPCIDPDSFAFEAVVHEAVADDSQVEAAIRSITAWAARSQHYNGLDRCYQRLEHRDDFPGNEADDSIKIRYLAQKGWDGEACGRALSSQDDSGPSAVFAELHEAVHTGAEWCKVCGTFIHEIATRKWRHQRPMPNGDPWDHKAQPGGTKADDLRWGHAGRAALDRHIKPPEAELHDEPEPALPETDSADEDEEIKPGDTKLGWLMSGEGGQDKSNSDIAAMARQFLKEGAKAFTPAEQRQIIDEGEGALAANFDALDITGTHYEALEAALAAEEDDEELLFG